MFLRPLLPHSILDAENRWFVPLLAELTVTNVALFTGFAIMVVHLVTALHFTAAQAATVMVVSSLGLRFSRVGLAPFIDRLSPRRVIPAAILLSMAGYLGLTQVQGLGAVCLCVLAIGTGYGTNGMLVTTLASYATKPGEKSFPIYALMNIGTNLAASLAPLAANALRLQVAPAAPFYFSACVLLGSLLIALRLSPATPSAYRGVRMRHALGPLLRDRGFWAALGMVAAAWAIYTQKFAATPLFIDSGLHRPEYLGLAITANALLILLVSMPAASVVRRHRIPARRVLASAFALYALAYGLLGVTGDLIGLAAALVLWSVAEALLMPQLNALIAECTSPANRLAGFSLSAVAIGTGEAIGNAAGAAMMTLTLANGHASGCYLVFAGAAIIACGAALSLHESTLRTEPVA